MRLIVSAVLWALFIALNFTLVVSISLEQSFRRAVPPHFQLGRTIFHNGMWDCSAHVYKVKKFDNNPVLPIPEGYSDFIRSKSFYNQISNENYGGLLEKTATEALSCTEENREVNAEYHATLENTRTYFLYSKRGRSFWAYNPDTKRLFFVSGE